VLDPAYDVAGIGAGQAGLASSYFLNHYGLRHIVLERGSIGESWRTQGWDSFVLNSPNKFNILPGDADQGAKPDGFDPATAFRMCRDCIMLDCRGFASANSASSPGSWKIRRSSLKK